MEEDKWRMREREKALQNEEEERETEKKLDQKEVGDEGNDLKATFSAVPVPAQISSYL